MWKKLLHSNYTRRETFTAPVTTEKNLAMDGHDFEFLVDRKSVIYIAKKIHPAGSVTQYTLEEPVIQEFDKDSQTVVFDWRSLDHVPPSESCVGDYSDYL